MLSYTNLASLLTFSYMTKCSLKQQILTIRKGLLQSMYTGKLIQLVYEEHVNKLTSVFYAYVLLLIVYRGTLLKWSPTGQ